MWRLTNCYSNGSVYTSYRFHMDMDHCDQLLCWIVSERVRNHPHLPRQFLLLFCGHPQAPSGRLETRPRRLRESSAPPVPAQPSPCLYTSLNPPFGIRPMDLSDQKNASSHCPANNPSPPNDPPKTNRSSEESNAEPRREMPPVLSRSFFGLRPAPPPAQSAKQKRGKFPPRRLHPVKSFVSSHTQSSSDGSKHRQIPKHASWNQNENPLFSSAPSRLIL